MILLSPAAPVVEGENVTLLCRTKNPSKLPANFFKDDHPIKSETANHTTIYQASKADQGSYKCHISGHGESPSSWLLIQGKERRIKSTVDLNILEVSNRWKNKTTQLVVCTNSYYNLELPETSLHFKIKRLNKSSWSWSYSGLENIW